MKNLFSKSTICLLATILGLAVNAAFAQQSSISIDADDGAQLGFSISVDGEHLYGDPISVSPSSALDQLELDVRFDGLDAHPFLDLQVNFDGQHGQARVRTQISSNYTAWIDRAELRLYDVHSGHFIKSVDVAPNQPSSWNLDDLGRNAVLMTARIYDAKDRFDETRTIYLDLDKKKNRLPKANGRAACNHVCGPKYPYKWRSGCHVR